jgi:hypothetical protein
MQQKFDLQTKQPPPPPPSPTGNLSVFNTPTNPYATQGVPNPPTGNVMTKQPLSKDKYAQTTQPVYNHHGAWGSVGDALAVQGSGGGMADYQQAQVMPGSQQIGGGMPPPPSYSPGGRKGSFADLARGASTAPGLRDGIIDRSPTSAFGANPRQVPEPPDGTGNGAGNGAGTGNWQGWNPSAVNQYGGQQIAGSAPSQADYQSVQGYADAAYENARRYLDPQQETENQRFDQELINKGIDPNSPMGQKAAQQLAMQQADANNAAAFNAMQFGQGIQNQMAQQEQFNQGLAGQMQQALWANQLGASGQDLDWTLGKMGNELGYAGLDTQSQIASSANATQKYLGKLSQELGLGQLDLARQGQNFNQMQTGWENQFNVKQYNDQQDLIRMALLNQNLNQNPVPNYGEATPNPGYIADRGAGSGGINYSF